MTGGQVVRKPLRLRKQPDRTLDERLLLRVPRLAQMLARFLDRLPPASRFRQAVHRRSARLGVQAFNRGDLEFVMLGHHSDCEWHAPSEMVEAGFVEPCYRGPGGYRQLISDWCDVGDLYLERADACCSRAWL